MRLFLFFLLILCPLAAQDAAQDAAVKHRLPVLSSVFPQGARPGAKLQVEVLGEYLDRASEVTFLDSSIRGKVLESAPMRLALEFEVAQDAAFGPHYFRVLTPRGPSGVLLFRIGDQPHILEREPNTTVDEAMEVAVPATVNGRLNVDGDFDFFRFRAQAGETWIFDLRSARNGSGLDAALILLDAQGRKLGHVEETFIWDPLIAHTFRAAGDYYAVVQPTHRSLDPNFAYQLDIRQAPHLDTVSPISLQPGAESEVTLYGAGLGGKQPRLWFEALGLSGEVLQLRGTTAVAKIRVPANASPGAYQLAVFTEGGRSNPASFLIDDLPVHPGGDTIHPPVSILGTARYRRPERFWLDARKDQQLVFEGRAQRFGSPADLIVRLLDEKGKQVAVNDDGNFAGAAFNKDPRLSHKFKDAGRYQLEIRNLSAVTGEDFPYVLRVDEPRPGFELTLATDQPYVYPGESATLKVTAVRRDGFDAAIPLSISGLPEGVTAEPAEIPAGKNEGVIRLKAEAVQPGTHGRIRVAAGAGAEVAWRSVRIASGGGEGATFARVDQATLSVVEKPLFSLEAQSSTVNLVKGGAAEVPVTIVRAKGFDGEIRFSAESLPPGVTLEPAVAAAGAVDATIRLRADERAPTGRYPRVAILGVTADGHSQEAPRIAVQVD